MQQLLKDIAEQHHLVLKEVESLSGGDINRVFLLRTNAGAYVLKLNKAEAFPGMFEAEAEGLQLLESSFSFRIPKVIASGTSASSSYLLLEYLTPGKASSNFELEFAQNLAKMHQVTHQKFGLDRSNYIGSLRQTNHWQPSASEYYILNRLEPQFKIATNRGYDFGNLEKFYKNVTESVPNDSPALIHGDLWNGNFLISENGKPALIDPAVSFGIREMDLAMMALFGGFPSKIFDLYNELFPLEEDWQSRTDLWQLYYLLVHLNIFGRGYLSQVCAVMKLYF